MRDKQRKSRVKSEKKDGEKMKITNTAKSEEFSEKHLTVEKLNNGDYKVTALNERSELGRPNTKNEIEMTFTQNGFNALVGSMMAVSGGNYFEK